MTDAFISYSRLDSVFAHRLHEFLQDRANPIQPDKTLDLWIDQHDIEYSTDWWQRICKGIDDAANVIVILSNNYLASEVCNEEFVYAQKMGKPIIPVVVGELSPESYQALRQQRIVERKDWKRNPVHLADESYEKIHKINFISLIDLGFEEAARQTVNSIFQDIAYKDGLRDWTNSASKWKDKQQKANYLLTGGELEDAERWQSAAKAKQLPVDHALSDYIQRSREAQSWRSRRNLSLAIIVPIGLALLSFFLYQAIGNLASEESIRQSNELARQSEATLIEQSDLGMLLALQAYRISPSYEARSNLYTAAYFNPYLRRYLHPANGRAENIAISPDNQLIAVAYPNSFQIVLIDARTGEIAGQIIDTSFNIVTPYTLAFEEDSRSLRVAGMFGEIARYDTETGQLIEILVESDFAAGAIIDAQFSGDNRYLVSSNLDVASNEETIVITNSSTGRQQSLYSFENDIATAAEVAISPDSRYVSIALGTSSFQLYDAENEDLRIIDNDNGLYRGGAFSADSRFLAYAYTENDDARTHYLVLDLEEDEIIREWEDDRNVQQLIIDSEGETLYAVYEIGDLAAYDIATGQRKYLQQGAHSASPSSLALSADGTLLVTGTATGEILLWNTQSLPAMTEAYPSAGAFAGFLNQAEIAFINETSELAFWNFHENSVRPMENSPELSWLSRRANFIWGYDASTEDLTLWNTNSGLVGSIFQQSAPELHTQSVDLSPDGHLLVGIDFEGFLMVWDVARQSELSRLNILESVTYPQMRELMQTGIVHLQARFRNNASIVVSLLDRVLLYRLGENASLELQTSFEMPTNFANEFIDALAVSPDGQMVALGSLTGDEILLWYPDSGSSQILEAESQGISANSLAFHPYLPLLVSGSSNGELQFWDTELALSLGQVIKTSDDAILALDFSPDGRMMLSSGDNGLRIWPADIRALNESICKRISRNFSDEEWKQYFGTETPEMLCPEVWLEEADYLAFAGETEAARERFSLLMNLSDMSPDLSDAICFYGALHGFTELVKPACESLELSYSSPDSLEGRISAHEAYSSPYAVVSDLRLNSFIRPESRVEGSLQAEGDSFTEEEWANWASSLTIPMNNFILSSDTFRDLPYKMHSASLIETTTGQGLEVEIHSPNGIVLYQLQFAPFNSLRSWRADAQILEIEGVEVAHHGREYVALVHAIGQDLLIHLGAEETVPESDMEAILARILLYTPDPLTGSMRSFELENRLETFDLDFNPHLSANLFEGMGIVIDAVAYVPSAFFASSADNIAPNADNVFYMRLSLGKAEPFIAVYSSNGAFDDTESLYEEDGFRSNLLNVGIAQIIEIAGLDVGKELPQDRNYIQYYFVRDGVTFNISADLSPDEGMTIELIEEIVRRFIEAP